MKRGRSLKRPEVLISENFFGKNGIFIPNNGIIIAINQDPIYNEYFCRFENPHCA
jgi:hypothetical protein